MDDMQLQNVPKTTSSPVHLRIEEIAQIRTDNPYFEKIWLTTSLGSHSVSNYLANISHTLSASFMEPLSQEIRARIRTSAAEKNSAHSNGKAISSSSSSMLVSAMTRLDELQKLPQDWDSYDAEPISQHAIAKAKLILISVMKTFSNAIGDVVQLTDVIPIADGGVQLEWVGPHAELEIEVSPNSNVSLLFISGSDERRSYEESENTSIDDVYNMIARLIHSQYDNQSF